MTTVLGDLEWIRLRIPPLRIVSWRRARQEHTGRLGVAQIFDRKLGRRTFVALHLAKGSGLIYAMPHGEGAPLCTGSVWRRMTLCIISAILIRDPDAFAANIAVDKSVPPRVALPALA